MKKDLSHLKKGVAMLTKKFNKLFSTKNLLETLELYKKTKGYHETKELIANGAFVKSLEKGFVPEPMSGFEIPKSNGEMRKLAQASITSKVVQKIIADALLDAVKFNDKSYAFRKGKGVLKAVNRSKDFLKKYQYIAKADVDDFFDSINQKKLILILEKVIEDKKILMLISLFLKNGMMKQNEWLDKSQGVYQGDVLSPILSNLYLHSFDEALEKRGIDFVRFADDMLFFAKSEKEAKKNLAVATAYLKALDLNFGEDKSYLANRHDGFEFLGLRFKGKVIEMDNERFQKKLSTLSKKTKKKDLLKSIGFINEYLVGIRHYYFKVLTDKHQLLLIAEHIDEILVKKIALAKKSKEINKKSKFIQLLVTLQDFEHNTKEEKQRHAHNLVARAYEALTLEKPLENAQKQMTKKKRSFLQEQIKSSEIILNRFGLYISMSKGKIVVKEYGKVIQTSPVNWVTRIIVMTKGVSISSNLILECSKRKIDIDFIEKSKPYAQITYYNVVSNELHLKQLDLKNSKKGFKTAKAIVKAKMKNQINLIKYSSRYRERKQPEVFEELERCIEQMEGISKKLKEAKDVPSLMGYEGSLSVLYWKCFGLIISEKEFKRETLNAPDAINQSLNYGYAFIYHRVQSALLKTGVNLYHSFLHSSQANKPTLVFDMVEVFRQMVVDREIISILTHGQKLNSNKGRLTKKSIKIITENIQERLVTPTKWRKGKYKIVTIIDEQALELSHVIKGVKSNFKGFVGRF
ncbi:MAG: Retron-type RNA-directed DNA polymerase [uncultured Sulfurovum sp.]|uniref:CRISPR-associated endonuclease Cas1 n=1 Tax=uncultured Sulfurovum sp. TaxID=269237 RepID=A0A6S6U9W9_9BACT|nr:MAG: Retron-type RNA-directed DNA polymerase [uncultured Sulfurovum sp.]